MNKLTRTLGSPILTVCCLLSLAALVISGTLYQVDHGLYEAKERFFGSWFLFAAPLLPLPGVKTVLVALLVNLIASASKRFSFGWKNAGMILSHLGVLILVGGAGLASYYTREASVTLYEGERAATGTDVSGIVLPIDIELLSFSMSVHPGTGMAKSYQSRVRVKGKGIDRETVIAMNRPLRYRSYSLYQTGYDGEPGRYSSTLSVVYNPLRVLPYAASVIITAGLLLHFAIAFVLALLASRRKTHA